MTAFRAIAAANPFSNKIEDPKLMHIAFLQGISAEADIDRLSELRSNGEEFKLAEQAFYLYAPNGIARSKLAANVEKCLGVASTSRNWRTTTKVLDLLNQLN